jgi:hypothetical protein
VWSYIGAKMVNVGPKIKSEEKSRVLDILYSDIENQKSYRKIALSYEGSTPCKRSKSASNQSNGCSLVVHQKF